MSKDHLFDDNKNIETTFGPSPSKIPTIEACYVFKPVAVSEKSIMLRDFLGICSIREIFSILEMAEHTVDFSFYPY